MKVAEVQLEDSLAAHEVYACDQYGDPVRHCRREAEAVDAHIHNGDENIIQDGIQDEHSAYACKAQLLFLLELQESQQLCSDEIRNNARADAREVDHEISCQRVIGLYAEA